jgi:hypothetical protein
MKKEKEIGFSMPVSLARARKKPLLKVFVWLYKLQLCSNYYALLPLNLVAMLYRVNEST